MIRIQVLRNAQTRKRSMRCPAFAPSIQLQIHVRAAASDPPSHLACIAGRHDGGLGYRPHHHGWILAAARVRRRPSSAQRLAVPGQQLGAFDYRDCTRREPMSSSESLLSHCPPGPPGPSFSPSCAFPPHVSSQPPLAPPPSHFAYHPHAGSRPPATCLRSSFLLPFSPFAALPRGRRSLALLILCPLPAARLRCDAAGTRPKCDRVRR